MCLRNIYYPLVRDENDKRKILFNYGIKILDRETFSDMVNIRRECHYARLGASKYQLLNRLFDVEHIIDIDKMVQVPCGCCRECLDDISRQWAFRILKEASKYDNNYFITFTFDDEHVPSNGMLDSLFYTPFNKTLKNKLRSIGCKSDFRFYGIGEYGSKGGRPHYHCIYFNLDIPDLKFKCKDKKGFLHFESKFLESIWRNGFVDIGTVDVGSACYVARYCEKKRRLNKSERQELLDKGVVPEFSRMSRRPGIGADALEELQQDFERGVFTHFVHGKSYSLPLYYSRKIKELLEGSKVLEEYEAQALQNSMTKINEYLCIADTGVDLQIVLDEKDVVKKRNL